MLVFSEYQTDTIDLALDFMATKIVRRIMNLVLASEIILYCILLPRGKGVFHFNQKRNPPRGRGSLSSPQK